MKLRWIITAGLVTVALLCAYFLLRSESPEQRAVEETRRALRQQGFKTELAEFNFSSTPELGARAAVLTNTDLGLSRSSIDYGRRSVIWRERPEFMVAVGPGAALTFWNQERPGSYFGDALWPTLDEALKENRAGLDAACRAALSGPIRFDLTATQGTPMQFRHAVLVRGLVQALGTRAILELHDGNHQAAWTNLLASSRLVTAWEVESVEVPHLVRFTCAALGYDLTWQALQAGGWSDAQLDTLQHEWDSVEFLKGLPDAIAFARASVTASVRLEREQPMSGPGWTIRDWFRAPGSAWNGLNYRWNQVRYRHHGSYEDEKGLLLFYRDRELEVRAAVRSPTWSEMRQLPGVTNLVAFQSKYASRMQTMISSRQFGLRARGGPGFLGRAAEAEARRRLLVTAIALERYRGKHGAYPKALSELVPDLLKAPPVDFMDGQPLRYRPTEDGHFVLYSVGLDCVDDGGEMQRPRRRGSPDDGQPPGFSIPEGTDLVWPRPASAAELQGRPAG